MEFDGWAANVDRLGEIAGEDTGTYAGYLAALRAAAGGVHRRRRHLLRPRPPDRAHPRSERRPRPRALYDRGLRGAGRRRRRGGVPGAHAAGVRPDVARRRPGHAAAPRRGAQPQPVAARPARPRRRRRHAAGHRVRARARPAAGRVRQRPAAAGGALHPRRVHLHPGTRPARRRLRRAATSARPGGSWTPPRCCAGSARRSPRRRASTTPPGSSTTPARSAPSRYATTWPAGSTPPTWPGWSPSTGCRGRGRRDHRRPGVPAAEAGLQVRRRACHDHHHRRRGARRALPHRRRGRRLGRDQPGRLLGHLRRADHRRRRRPAPGSPSPTAGATRSPARRSARSPTTCGAAPSRRSPPTRSRSGAR